MHRDAKFSYNNDMMKQRKTGRKTLKNIIFVKMLQLTYYLIAYVLRVNGNNISTFPLPIELFFYFLYI
jgi:hypothetical protein